MTNNGSLIADGGYVQYQQTQRNFNAWGSKCWFIWIYLNSSIDQRTGNVVIGGDDNNFININGDMTYQEQIQHTNRFFKHYRYQCVYGGKQCERSNVVKFQQKRKKCLFLTVQ